MSVTVKVFHNESRNRFFTYEFGDELRLVATIELRADAVHARWQVDLLADHVWKQLQNDYPGERTDWAIAYTEGRNRSLSKGDVIVIGETALRVEGVGFQVVTLPAQTLGAFEHEFHGR